MFDYCYNKIKFITAWLNIHRMKLFSARNGIVKPKDIIQKESMDLDLQISLWNVLSLRVWIAQEGIFVSDNPQFHRFIIDIWIHFFKNPLDSLDTVWQATYNKLRKFYFKFKWYEVYDFLEFISKNPFMQGCDSFMQECNLALEKERSAYRFVGKEIVEITSSEEIDTMENALINSPSNVQHHLESALKTFGDRKNPDYRNSIKESISAVEAFLRKLSGNDKVTLSAALSIIEKTEKVNIHPALKDAFSRLYGYTNDADGIRHALLEEHNLKSEDAKFMLISCSAFINYLMIKGEKAGIKY